MCMKHIYTSILIFFISISTVACSSNINLKDVVVDTIDGVVVVYSNKTIKEKQTSGLGTGFFIDENVVLTNHHVVANSDSLFIRNSKSNKKYKAIIIAKDELSDLAIISIDKWDLYKKTEKWKSLGFMPSKDLQIGQRVWVFGHPWGLEYSVSEGIIAALDRRIDRSPQFFIQVDARIFNGNSGGPLLDYNGKVIGVNSRMLAQSGGSYGFSLTGDFVQKVVRQLRKYKEAHWIKLGITFKIKSNGNLYIDALVDGIAKRHGLEVGDEVVRILSMNFPDKGRKILDINDLLIGLSMLEKDELFWFEIIRKDKKKIIPLVAQNIK